MLPLTGHISSSNPSIFLSSTHYSLSHHSRWHNHLFFPMLLLFVRVHTETIISLLKITPLAIKKMLYWSKAVQQIIWPPHYHGGHDSHTYQVPSHRFCSMLIALFFNIKVCSLSVSFCIAQFLKEVSLQEGTLAVSCNCLHKAV